MKHNLHQVTVAAQHATTQFHASHAEVTDLRAIGLIALPFLFLGLARTVIKGRREGREIAEASAAAERYEQRYAA